MNQIKEIMETQLTERELIIFLLVESGMGYRDLGRRLLISDKQVGRIYDSANEKLDKLGKIFQTPVEKKS